MKEERYFYVPNADRNNELPPEETTHALRVLRLQSGDDMFLRELLSRRSQLGNP